MSAERDAWYKRPGSAERERTRTDQYRGDTALSLKFSTTGTAWSSPTSPNRSDTMESSLRVTLHGTLYEITNFASFVQTYLTASLRPHPASIRPLKDGWVRLCRVDGSNAVSPLPPPCRTDDMGHFELDLSQAPDAPVFVIAGGSEKLRKNYWYRSACVRPGALGQHALEIYLARAAISDESGFSQADLAGLLEQTKKQVADLERIHGTITPNGIALTVSEKAGRHRAGSCSSPISPVI